ncbi:hypothetical protein A7Q26_21975 [Sphingobium sp. TCM1]|nr:hypothetical protein A7Q26_21975 [Sphingobium sp. TCM1]
MTLIHFDFPEGREPGEYAVATLSRHRWRDGDVPVKRARLTKGSIGRKLERKEGEGIIATATRVASGQQVRGTMAPHKESAGRSI